MEHYDENEMNSKSVALVATATELAITDDKSLAFGLDILARAKETKKIISNWFAPQIAAAHTAHKIMTAKRAETLKPVDRVISEVNTKAATFHAAQEAARRKEQARLDEITRKKEEAERERLLKQAVKAEDKGNAEKSEALLEQAETTFIPPTIVPETKRVDTEAGSTSFIKDIEISVTDEIAIYAEIAARNLPPLCAVISPMAIKRWAKVNGKAPGQYRGFTIREVSRLATRGAK